MCDDDLKSLKITRIANRVRDKNEISEKVCLTDKQSGYSTTRSIKSTKRLDLKTPKSRGVDPTIMSRLTDAVDNYKNSVKISNRSNYGEQAGIINPRLANANFNREKPTNYPEPGNLTDRNVPTAVINRKRKLIKQLDIMKEQAKSRLNYGIEQILARAQNNDGQELSEQQGQELSDQVDFLHMEYNNTIDMINMNKAKVEKSYMNIANNKNKAVNVVEKMKNVEKDVFSQFGHSEKAIVILAPRVLRSRTPSPDRIDAFVDRSQKEREMIQAKNRTKDMANNGNVQGTAMQKKKENTQTRYNAAASKPETFRKTMQPDQRNRAALYHQAALAGTRSSTIINPQLLAANSASVIRTMRKLKNYTKHEKNENEIYERPCNMESTCKIKSTASPTQMKIINKQLSNIVSSEIKNAERARQLVTGRKKTVDFDRLSMEQAIAANECGSKKLMSNKLTTIKTPNIPGTTTLAQEAEEAKRLERAARAAQIRKSTKVQNRAVLRETEAKPFINPKTAAEAKCAASRNLQRSLGVTVQRNEEPIKLPKKQSSKCGINSKAGSRTVSKSSIKPIHNKEPELTENEKKMKQAKRISDTRKLYQQKSISSIRGTKFPLDTRSEAEAARNSLRKPILKPKPPILNDEIVRAERARQIVESRKIANEHHEATYRQDVAANILDPKLVDDAKVSNIRNLQQRTLSRAAADIAEETMRAKRAKALVEEHKLAVQRNIGATRHTVDERAVKLISDKIDKSKQISTVKTELDRGTERLQRIEQARKMASQISITSAISFMSGTQNSASTLRTKISVRSHVGFFAGPEEDRQIEMMITQTNYGPIQKLKKLKADIETKYAAMKENALSEIKASAQCFPVDREVEQNRIANQICETADFLDLEKRIKLDTIAAINDELRRLDIQFIDKTKTLQAESDERKEYHSGIKFLYDELSEKKHLALKEGLNNLKSPCRTEERATRSIYTLESRLSEVYKSHGFSSPKKVQLPENKLQMSQWNTSEDILVQKEKILSCLETAIKETKNNKEFLENILIPIKKTPSIVLNESIQTAVLKEKKSASDKIIEVSKKQAKRMHLLKDLKTMPSDFPNISSFEGEDADNILEMVMNKQHGLNYLTPPHNFVDSLVSTKTPKLKIIGNSIERPTNEIVPLSIPTTVLNAENILPGDDIDISIRINQTELPKTDAAAETLKEQIPSVCLNQKPTYPLDETEYPMTVNSYAYETYFQVRGTAKPAWFPGYFSVMPSDKGVSLIVKNSPSEVLLEAWERMEPNFEV